MRFTMKIMDKVLAITAMFALIIALLLTSFQVAIYGDPDYKFYEKEQSATDEITEIRLTDEEIEES